MNHAASLLVLCLTLLSACEPAASPEPAPVDTRADEAAIRAAGAAFSAAYMRGDIDAMMALYTEDAAIFPNNRDMIQGQEALRTYWTLPPGRVVTHHQATPSQIEIDGDMASDYGIYEISGTNDGEPWGPSYGKYVIVWRRTADSTWKMHLDMWNSRPGPEE